MHAVDSLLQTTTPRRVCSACAALNDAGTAHASTAQSSRSGEYRYTRRAAPVVGSPARRRGINITFPLTTIAAEKGRSAGPRARCDHCLLAGSYRSMKRRVGSDFEQSADQHPPKTYRLPRCATATAAT